MEPREDTISGLDVRGPDGTGEPMSSVSRRDQVAQATVAVDAGVAPAPSPLDAAPPKPPTTRPPMPPPPTPAPAKPAPPRQPPPPPTPTPPRTP